MSDALEFCPEKYTRRSAHELPRRAQFQTGVVLNCMLAEDTVVTLFSYVLALTPAFLEREDYSPIVSVLDNQYKYLVWFPG